MDTKMAAAFFTFCVHAVLGSGLTREELEEVLRDVEDDRNA